MRSQMSATSECDWNFHVERLEEAIAPKWSQKPAIHQEFYSEIEGDNGSAVHATSTELVRP